MGYSSSMCVLAYEEYFTDDIRIGGTGLLGRYCGAYLVGNFQSNPYLQGRYVNWPLLQAVLSKAFLVESEITT
jgi:hypothetical protein